MACALHRAARHTLQRAARLITPGLLVMCVLAAAVLIHSYRYIIVFGFPVASHGVTVIVEDGACYIFDESSTFGYLSKPKYGFWNVSHISEVKPFGERFGETVPGGFVCTGALKGCGRDYLVAIVVKGNGDHFPNVHQAKFLSFWLWTMSSTVYDPGGGPGLFSGREGVERMSMVAFPLWFAAVALGFSPGFVAWRYLRRLRRLKRGLCMTCGYDLRASKDRCPECGTPTTASQRL